MRIEVSMKINQPTSQLAPSQRSVLAAIPLEGMGESHDIAGYSKIVGKEASDTYVSLVPPDQLGCNPNQVGAANFANLSIAGKLQGLQLRDQAHSTAVKMAVGILLGGSGISLQSLERTLQGFPHRSLDSVADLQVQAASFTENPMFFSGRPGDDFVKLAEKTASALTVQDDLSFLLAGVALGAHAMDPKGIGATIKGRSAFDDPRGNM